RADRADTPGTEPRSLRVGSAPCGRVGRGASSRTLFDARRALRRRLIEAGGRSGRIDRATGGSGRSRALLLRHAPVSVMTGAAMRCGWADGHYGSAAASPEDGGGE